MSCRQWVSATPEATRDSRQVRRADYSHPFTALDALRNIFINFADGRRAVTDING